jgi:hypothetical protein
VDINRATGIVMLEDASQGRSVREGQLATARAGR